MNRKQWIAAGILITILIVVGVVLLQNKNSDEPVPLDAVQDTPVSVLAYCSEEDVKPCVVAFSVDADGNMLVNILLPELSFPHFHLKITRGENEIDYTCHRVSTALNNAFCIGEKLPPGETLHLMLFSTREKKLLSEGDLSIIGLALPTLTVALPIVEESTPPEPTEGTLPNVPTATPTQFRGPLPTKSKPTQPPTPTQPSYPNPSYP